MKKLRTRSRGGLKAKAALAAVKGDTTLVELGNSVRCIRTRAPSASSYCSCGLLICSTPQTIELDIPMATQVQTFSLSP